jgi:hypothetical protein
MSNITEQFYYINHILAVSREHASTKSGTGFTKGEPAFVAENLKVLHRLAKLYSERIYEDGTLKDAFAIALIRQARKLAWTGFNIRAFSCAMKTLMWCPKGVSKYIFTQTIYRVHRGLSKSRI